MNTACAMNIGPKERRKRWITGLVLLLVTANFAFLLIQSGMDRLWRLSLVLPFTFCFLCILQARAKTCVVLAVQGVRNMDQGNQKLNDQAMDVAVRKTAIRVLIQAIVAANLLTAVIFFI